MTQEEKAKAYDKALKKAEQLHVEDCSAEAKDACEYIFPELAESEDERIRKWIITQLETNYKGNYWANKAIEYLEKQKDIFGERAQNITANMLEDGIEGIQRELIEFLSNTVNASWVDIIQSADAYAERIRNIIEKQKEQKPAEWSEEDDFYRQSIIEFIDTLNVYAHSRTNMKMWLKSLRPQTHWKPTEEQMKALEKAFRKEGTDEYRHTINSLYQDLKKLM